MVAERLIPDSFVMEKGKLLADLRQELLAALDPAKPLGDVVVALRGLKQRGVSREEVRAALEDLRQSAPDEDAEDRVLEGLDLVVGFCRPHMRIWES